MLTKRPFRWILDLHRLIVGRCRGRKKKARIKRERERENIIDICNNENIERNRIPSLTSNVFIPISARLTVDDVQDGGIGEELQLLQAELLQLAAVHFLSRPKEEEEKNEPKGEEEEKKKP